MSRAKNFLAPFVFFVTSLAFSFATPTTAHAKSIYSETLNGNGEKRVSVQRTFTAPKSGQYFVKVKDISKVSDSSEVRGLEVSINGQSVRSKLGDVIESVASTESVIPVDLIAGANRVDFGFAGSSSTRIQYSIETSKDEVKTPKVEIDKSSESSITWSLDPKNPLRVSFDSKSNDSKTATYTWKIKTQAGRVETIKRKSFTYLFGAEGRYSAELVVNDKGSDISHDNRVLNIAPLSKMVADEILLSNPKMNGSFFGQTSFKRSLKLPQAQLAKLKVTNGDGRDFDIKNCEGLSVIDGISCGFSNFVSTTKRSLARAKSVTVQVNGQKVATSKELNQETKSFDVVVPLNISNQIEVEVDGYLTSSASFEVQSLEVNEAPVSVVSEEKGYNYLPTEGIARTLELSAADSTDDNDQVVSYRFQVKKKGAKGFSIDTDWQGSPRGTLPIKDPGQYEVVTSARDRFGAVGTSSNMFTILSNSSPVITQAYYRTTNNFSPFQVRAEVRATDADPGDTLEYNFAFSNGVTTGYQTANNALTTFTSGGAQSVVITVRDSTGATTSTTLNLAIGSNLIPVPAFTMTPRGANSPNTIEFNASNSYDPDGYNSNLRYFWTFGDGSPQVEAKIATHTFSAGEWFVTLNVLDNRSGVGSLTRAVFSWVNNPPVPSYVFTRGPADRQINFDASSSTAGDSAIGSYKFELGNGITQTVTSPLLSYTYASAGVYSTSLRVYDQEGDANVLGQTITVFNGVKPTANIVLASSDPMIPATFVLNATGSVSPTSGATITGYKWTLPGGTILTTPTVTYNTSNWGSVPIQLEVQDSVGEWSDPVVKTYRAIPGTIPVAQIQSNLTTIALGQTIQLSGLNSYSTNPFIGLSNFEWTMPNGNKLYGANQSVTLSSTGLKTISLKVTDSKGFVSNSATIQVNVITRQNPEAVMTITTNGSTIIPVAGHLSAAGSTTPNPGATLTGFEWKVTAPTTPMPTEFSLFGAEVDMSFNQATTFTVSLRVFDSAGGTSAWVSQQFGPVVNTIPLAFIGGGDIIDTAPSNLTFYGAGSYDPDGHSLIAWHWQFSDGGEAYGPTPSHTFAEPGVYTATLRVQDSFWSWSDPVSITVTVTQNLAPLAFLEIENVPGNRYQKIFKDQGSYDPEGMILSHHWWISGFAGTVGTGVEVPFTFPAPGTYEVHLNVFDNKGVLGTNSAFVTITENLPPVAVIHAAPSSTVPFRFDFTAAASTDDVSIASYSWDFGDGSTATGASVSHVYLEKDFYDVKLRVVDNEGAYTDIQQTVNSQSYIDQNPTAVISGKEDEPYLETAHAPSSVTAARIPALITLNADESVITPRTSAGVTYSWNAGVLGNYEGREISLNVNQTGIFPVALTVTDSDGRISTSTTQIDTSAASCGQYDGDNICPYVLGTPDNVVDGTVSSLTIATGVVYAIDPASISGTHAISFEDSEGESIDVSSIATVVGSNIEIPISGLLTLLDVHPEPFNVRVSFISADGQSVGAGVVRNVRIAKKALTILLPAGATDLEVVGGNSNFTFRKQNPASSTVVRVLPFGSYAASASVASGRIITNFEIDDQFNGVVELIEPVGIQSMVVRKADLENQFDLRSLPSVDQFGVSSVSLPYTPTLNEFPKQNSFSIAQKSGSLNMMTANNFSSNCGEQPPFPIVDVGPTKRPENINWGKYLSNNLDWPVDPSASSFTPVSSKAIKNKKISGFCELQSPTYMANQYWAWLLSANLRCCGSNTICRQQVHAQDAFLRQGTHLETSNVTYKAEFKDFDTGLIESRSVTTTFQKAAAKAGYFRSTMSSQMGLAIDGNVPGWSIPFPFEIPVPANIQSPLVRVSVSSNYPTQHPGFWGAHFYYCVMSTGPTDFEPTLEILQTASAGSNDGHKNAHAAMTGITRLLPVSKDDREEFNIFGWSSTKWEYSPKFKLTAQGTYNRTEFNTANPATLNPRVTVKLLKSEHPVGGSVSIVDYSCANNVCTGRFKFDGGRIFENVPALQLNSEGIVTSSELPYSARLKYAVDMTNNSKTISASHEVPHQLNYNLGAVTVPGAGADRQPSSAASYRCDWGYGQPEKGWSTFGKTGLLRYIRDTLKPLQATTDYWLLCNDGAQPFGGGFPGHEAHQIGQNIDIRPFSPTWEFANEFHKTLPAVKSGTTVVRPEMQAAKKVSAYGVLRTYLLALDAWPCQAETDSGCLSGQRKTAELCWQNFDNDSFYNGGACPAPQLSDYMLLYYTHASRKNAIYDLIKATESLRNGFLPLVSKTSSFTVKHSKILHSDGFNDRVPKIVGGVSSESPSGLAWNGELIFDGTLRYANGKSVPLYKLGARALTTSGCSALDSKWKISVDCSDILPFTNTSKYSTDGLHIKRVDNHLNHIHMEKYGD